MYVELLIGLFIAVVIFTPAYRFASSVLLRRAADSWRSDEAEAVLDVLARDLRCAASPIR